MDNLTVLKLDSTFKPIEVISWQEAFILTWLKKAWAVEYSTKWVSSAKESFQIPSVIALFQYIDEKYFCLPCNRKNLLLRDDYRCQYCNKGYGGDELTIDHVVPRSKGGKTTWTNAVIACYPCNQKKSNLLLKDSSVNLIKKPQKPSFRWIIKQRLKKTNIAWSGYL